jgi:hypothetical protein
MDKDDTKQTYLPNRPMCCRTATLPPLRLPSHVYRSTRSTLRTSFPRELGIQSIAQKSTVPLRIAPGAICTVKFTFVWGWMRRVRDKGVAVGCW